MQKAAHSTNATKAKFVTAEVCISITDSVTLKTAKPSEQRGLYLLIETE